MKRFIAKPTSKTALYVELLPSDIIDLTNSSDDGMPLSSSQSEDETDTFAGVYKCYLRRIVATPHRRGKLQKLTRRLENLCQSA
ncbi:hypothetical protein ABW21_db0207393 [Orbilia brochopaga]|nr:hypothetical protein ABW21_db0207393 [Drechslerella brochopaga]